VTAHTKASSTDRKEIPFGRFKKDGMGTVTATEKSDLSLRVCSYEDRPEAMDGLILMGESLCRADPEVSLHLTVPDAPASVLAWAKRWNQITLSTTPPDGVTGWDVKPWLLLQELDAGSPAAIWLDTDMIIMRPISLLFEEFPRDLLIVAQEWAGNAAIPMTHYWNLRPGREIPSINSCVLRVTQAHRPLLKRYLQMTQQDRYRKAQTLPIHSRPIYLLGDQPLLIALLESEEFCQIPFEYLRLGRHIAQCAGSSVYRPHHRLLDLFRGLPPLIHGLGRKPWESTPSQGRIQKFMLDLATDVSPYVLAARGVAKDLDMTPRWLDARTSLGGVLRGLTWCHPGMAGLPLAILHAFHLKIGRIIAFSKRKADEKS